MENISLRNLYINKISKSINNLHKQINLLSSVDKKIINSILNNQHGGANNNGSDAINGSVNSSTAFLGFNKTINEDLNETYNNLNNDFITNFAEKTNELNSSIQKMQDIKDELKYLASEANIIRNLSDKLKATIKTFEKLFETIKDLLAVKVSFIPDDIKDIVIEVIKKNKKINDLSDAIDVSPNQNIKDNKSFIIETVNKVLDS
jgi:hypothetical protein